MLNPTPITTGTERRGGGHVEQIALAVLGVANKVKSGRS